MSLGVSNKAAQEYESGYTLDGKDLHLVWSLILLLY